MKPSADKNNQKKKRLRRAIILLILTALYAALMLDWRIARHVRFTHPNPNYIIFAIAQFLPVIILIIIQRHYLTLKNWAFLLAIPVSIFCGALFLLTCFSLFTQDTISNELVGTVQPFPIRVEIRRTSDSLSANSTYLVEKHQLIPGIIWEKELYYARGYDEVKVDVVDVHHLHCVFFNGSADGQKVVDLAVK